MVVQNPWKLRKDERVEDHARFPQRAALTIQPPCTTLSQHSPFEGRAHICGAVQHKGRPR